MPSEEEQDDLVRQIEAMLQSVEQVKAFGANVGAFWQTVFTATGDAEAATAITQTWVVCVVQSR